MIHCEFSFHLPRPSLNILFALNIQNFYIFPGFENSRRKFKHSSHNIFRKRGQWTIFLFSNEYRRWNYESPSEFEHRMWVDFPHKLLICVTCCLKIVHNRFISYISPSIKFLHVVSLELSKPQWSQHQCIQFK